MCTLNYQTQLLVVVSRYKWILYYTSVQNESLQKVGYGNLREGSGDSEHQALDLLGGFRGQGIVLGLSGCGFGTLHDRQDSYYEGA